MKASLSFFGIRCTIRHLVRERAIYSNGRPINSKPFTGEQPDSLLRVLAVRAFPGLFNSATMRGQCSCFSKYDRVKRACVMVGRLQVNMDTTPNCLKREIIFSSLICGFRAMFKVVSSSTALDFFSKYGIPNLFLKPQFS